MDGNGGCDFYASLSALQFKKFINCEVVYLISAQHYVNVVRDSQLCVVFITLDYFMYCICIFPCV